MITPLSDTQVWSETFSRSVMAIVSCIIWGLGLQVFWESSVHIEEVGPLLAPKQYLIGVFRVSGSPSNKHLGRPKPVNL